MDFKSVYIIGIIGAIITLAFTFIQKRKVTQYFEGTDALKKSANAICQGIYASLWTSGD